MLLFWRKWMNPREEKRTDAIEFVCRDFFFGPLVILESAHHEFDFIRRFEMLQVFQPIAFAFAAARAFEVHNSKDTRNDLGNVMRATGFEQHGKSDIAQRF